MEMAVAWAFALVLLGLFVWNLMFGDHEAEF